MKITTKRAVITLIAIAATTELAVLATGITDFPLYDANSEIGYIPRPSQAGSFLHKNSWEFNSLSMGASEFNPSDKVDTLLIGDSVVLGGNPYRQADRLGPTLQKESKNTVWPISAGSWALRNELIYLRNHPEVMRDIDNFIFVLNSEDFGKASSWACETTHPRTYPVSAAYYAFQKYIYNIKKCNKTQPELKVNDGNWQAELNEFFANPNVKDKPISFFLYPKKTEASLKDLAASALEIHTPNLMQNNSGNIRVFSVARDPRWSTTHYRDDIHPTIDGTKVLAAIINSPYESTELRHPQPQAQIF